MRSLYFMFPLLIVVGLLTGGWAEAAQKKTVSKNQEQAAATKAPQFEQNLRLGLRGSAAVEQLQEFLADKGHYSGAINGNYTLATFRAVQEFQKKNGLSQIGQFVGKTRVRANELLEELLLTDCTEDDDALDCVKKSLPDLTLLDLQWAPPTPIAGPDRAIPIVAVVKNLGTVDVKRPFSLLINGSPYRIDRLAAGAIARISTSVGLSIPKPTTIFASLDDEAKVRELRGDNNQIERTIPVKPTYEGQGTFTLRYWESLGLPNGLILRADGQITRARPPQMQFEIYDSTRGYALVYMTEPLRLKTSWSPKDRLPESFRIDVDTITLGPRENGTDWSVTFTVLAKI